MADQEAYVEGVAGRYASALFELALEAKALDKTADQLVQIQSLIDGSNDFLRLVRSPVYSADEQMSAVMAVLERAKIKGLVANFVGLVTRNRRLFAISDMIKAYGELLARHRGEISAEAASAHKLSAKQVKDLKAALKASAGSDVNLTMRVDPGLLGGLIVRVGSRMVDTSLKNKLDRLKIAMKEVG